MEIAIIFQLSGFTSTTFVFSPKGFDLNKNYRNKLSTSKHHRMLPFFTSATFFYNLTMKFNRTSHDVVQKRLSVDDSIGKRQMGLLGAIKKPPSDFLWRVHRETKKLLAKHYDIRWSLVRSQKQKTVVLSHKTNTCRNHANKKFTDHWKIIRICWYF